MTEEMMIRLGLDSRGVATGLESVKRKMEGTAHEIASGWKRVMGEITGALSATAIIMTLERAMGRAEAIRRQSEETGTTTGFVQDIQNLGRVAGLSGEAMERMMNKFVQNLPAGADVEQEFFNIADKIASIEDPATRAKMAVEAFGKSGVKMIPILASGSAEIRKMGDEFAKFSETDVEALDEAERAMKRWGNAFQVWVGRVAIGWERIWTGIKGEVSGKLPFGGMGFLRAWDMQHAIESVQTAGQAKSLKLAQEVAKSKAEQERIEKAIQQYESTAYDQAWKHASLSEKITLAKQDLASATSEVAMNEAEAWEQEAKILAVKETLADLEKKLADETERKLLAEKAHEETIRKTEATIAQGQRRLTQAEDPTRFTFEDLAQAPGPGGRAARYVEFMKRKARENAELGRFGLADAQAGEARRVKGLLQGAYGDHLIDPNAEIKEHLKNQEAHLAFLKNKAAGKGIPVDFGED